MITTSRKASRKVLLAAVAVLALSGSGVAAADEPADEPATVTAYSCDALTSASVPTVKKRLTDQGIDISDVTGPVGISCKKTARGKDGVEASVTGLDLVAFRCASAEEKSGTKVIFLEECAQSTSATG